MKRSATIRADESAVCIFAGGAALSGDLAIPEGAIGLVIFAHGSGSSRKSPRNRYVAKVIQNAGIATLLFDLLTPDEEAADMYTRHLRFDIGLLAWRLSNAVDWAASQIETRDMNVGLFGASTGAAAALVAARRPDSRVKAVVSRGGRSDLAGDHLAEVRCPVLLIVGEKDELVLQLNEAAAKRINAPVTIRTIAGATHLFEEPGTLEEAARLAAEFFELHLN